jgi:G3E family GTPase
VGCSLAASLVDLIKKIKRKHQPEFMFIEPSEMVVTQELQNVTAMGHRDIRYQIGPLITLVDAVRFASIWAERQQLVLGQIKGADVVALSRVDQLTDISPDAVCQILRPHCNGLYLLSIQDPERLEKIAESVPELNTD